VRLTGLKTAAFALGLNTEALAFNLELACAAVGEAGIACMAGVLEPEAGCAIAGAAEVAGVALVLDAAPFLTLFLSNGGIAWMSIPFGFFACPSA
jgi:hypothetical protein